jgi:hypothetical protein
MTSGGGSAMWRGVVVVLYSSSSYVWDHGPKHLALGISLFSTDKKISVSIRARRVWLVRGVGACFAGLSSLSDSRLWELAIGYGEVPGNCQI